MSSLLSELQKNKGGRFWPSVCADVDSRLANFQWSGGLKMLLDQLNGYAKRDHNEYGSWARQLAGR
jgi:hypothetical protein